jgi:hypothetical protein
VSERPIPWHPLLLAAFPVLSLFAQNVREDVTVGDVILPLAVVVGAAGVVAFVLAVGLGSAQRGALAASVLIIVALSWGYAARAGRGRVSEAVLLGAWGLLATVGLVLAVRAGPRLPGITRGLNVVALVLVAVNVAMVGVAGGLRFRPETTEIPGGAIALRPGEDPPDIFYLVMDRYAGTPTLERQFGFDNAAFLGGLRDRGFVVPEHTVANYPKTAHSLAASLNMTYLEFLTEEGGSGSSDWGPVYGTLREHRVGRALQDAGYTYVHIGSKWEPTRRNPFADANETTNDLSEFSRVLYRSTVVEPLARRLGLGGTALDPRERERRRTLNQFDSVAAAAERPGPTFVFAHILLPHPPYLFDRDGRPLTLEEERSRSLRENYLGQLEFANRKLTELFDRLLAGPDDPVIVLQADEGPHPVRYQADQERFPWPEATDEELEEKFSILNAYHLPGEAGVPEGITPVNTFRLILSRYLGADLPLLPDQAYVFRDQRHLYDFVEVGARLRMGGQAPAA